MLTIVYVITRSLPPSSSSSFIAQAQAAYSDLRTQLSAPGSVRHTITLIDNLTSEVWSNADGSRMLSGNTIGSPDTLSFDGALYLPASDDTQQVITFQTGSGGVITSHPNGSWSSATFNGEDVEAGEHYTVTTPADTASWMERYDPKDMSVACVDITSLTNEQKTARETLDALNTASDNVSKGLSGPEDILRIVETSNATEDRGVEHDAILGALHVYRVSYDSVLSGIDTSDIGTRGFQEFGFSPETYILRMIRSGSISPDGIESIHGTTRIIVDEILSAEDVGTDFFSPERLKFVYTPPDTENPDAWPSYELHNGCYRRGTHGLEWLDAQDEAQSRARIDALGAQAPSLGGGGF